MKKKPKVHKKLTLEEVKKRHKANPQDKELHEQVDMSSNKDEETLKKLLKKASNTPSSDT